MKDGKENSGLKEIREREITARRGALMLVVILAGFLASAALLAAGLILMDEGGWIGVCLVAACLLCVVCIVLCAGFHVVNPNEALVLTFFGQYYGTIKREGFYYVNPFATAFNPTTSARVLTAAANGKSTVSMSGGGKKISTKTMTLDNGTQKVNDVMGNPIVIGAVVIWKVVNPTQAVFTVENYKSFLSIQCDSTIRNIARLYPYDTMEDDTEEKTLRGSSQEIADQMQAELQARVASAGLQIQEVRINHLAYSEEIAAAMLQRQQAVAVIAARQKIVEGAVSMVRMALDQLSEEEIVVLDEERKAAMVSNLLVVLCANKDAQPVLNSGSIY